MLRPAISQKSIARQLKLSPATVSKSLRNHPDINPETRAKVLNFAAQYGYDVSQAALNARSHNGAVESRYVGVIIHDNHGPEFRDFPARGYMTGLSQLASKRDVSLIIHRFCGDSRAILSPVNQPPAMRKGGLEGLILIHRFDSDVVKELAQQLPVVTLTFNVQGARCHHVDSDHIGAMSKLVDHLARMGHRKIAYVGHPMRPLNSLARFGAFAQAMARYELSLDLNAVFNVYGNTLDYPELVDASHKCIQQGFTAIVTSVDTVGYHLWRGLSERGVRVPQDVSITGYDADEPLLGLPMLTSIRVPFDAMGEYALTQLLERIDSPTGPLTQTLFECDVVVGQSTGPVPSRSI